MKGLDFAGEKFGSYKFSDAKKLTYAFTRAKYNPELLSGDELIELEILNIAEKIAAETIAYLEIGLEQEEIKKRVLTALKERASEFFVTPTPEEAPAETPEIEKMIVESDTNHGRVQENFGAHLKTCHQRLARLINQYPALNIYQSNIPLLEKDEDLPNFQPDHYISLQGKINQRFRSAKKGSPLKNILGKAASRLKALILLERAFLLLKNTTYRDGLNTLERYQTDPKIHVNTRRAIFGVNFEEQIETSQLSNSMQSLEDAILRNDMDPSRPDLVHPKVRTTQELIEQLKGDGPILVVCSQRSTATYLNKLCRLQWDTNSAMIHGSDSAKAKNRARHQFVTDQCDKGNLDVVFSTNVAAQNIPLPRFAHVIVFNPLKNGEEETRVLSRVQEGGRMINLGIESERGKLNSNARQRRPAEPKQPTLPAQSQSIRGDQMGLFGGTVIPITRKRRHRR
jgi:hypothetical protein